MELESTIKQNNKNTYLKWIMIIVIALIITLPFHYVPSRGMVFPKNSLTFSYTIITESDICKLIDRYNNANFFERQAINNEPIIRKLKEKRIIIDKDSVNNSSITPEKHNLNSNSLQEGIDLLFSDCHSNISTSDRIAIYNLLGFRLYKDKKQFTIVEEGIEDNDPFTAGVIATDLNHDGIEELFVCYNERIALFIKEKNGSYEKNFDFIGTYPSVLSIFTKGYPHLIFMDIPGTTIPIYVWDGAKYTLHHQIELTQAEKLHPLRSLEEFANTKK